MSQKFSQFLVAQKEWDNDSEYTTDHDWTELWSTVLLLLDTSALGEGHVGAKPPLKCIMKIWHFGQFTITFLVLIIFFPKLGQ